MKHPLFTPPARAGQDDDERILPLINVVFLLLIFFMIVGSFTEVTPFEVEPPAASAGGPADEEAPLLHIGADGQLALGQETVSLAGLGPRLSADGAAPARLRIKADSRTEATRLVAVMEALRRVGVETIQLLTLERD